MTIQPLSTGSRSEARKPRKLMRSTLAALAIGTAALSSSSAFAGGWGHKGYGGHGGWHRSYGHHGFFGHSYPFYGFKKFHSPYFYSYSKC